jgi:hypothetical protein
LPRNGSGTYSLPAGNPVVTGTVISSTVQNNTTSDIATALTNSLAKDGQTTPTANLPMGGFKLTGLASGSAATDSLNLGQAQAQAYLYLGSVAGTDTITATTNPVTAAYTAGQTFRFVAAGANTGAATININSLGAKAITKRGTTALASGDILSGGLYQVTYDGTQFQLENPSLTIVPSDAITSASLADSALGVTMINGAIDATVAGNALTVAIKTQAGGTPSATDPVLVLFRSGTVTSGTYNVRSVTAATSVVISSGSTLGTVSGVTSNLDILAIDNAGTVELAVMNDVGNFVLDGSTLISTTAEGGAGGADSVGTPYSTTARSTVSYTPIGKVVSTQATAGTWATSPANVSIVPNYYPSSQTIKPALSATGLAPIYAARAWVNFNGSGVVAIRASGNVSSVTDNGTGDYTINFTTALPDADYSVSGMVQRSATDTNIYTSLYFGAAQQQTASSFRVQVRTGTTAALEDPIVAAYTVFR